MAAYLTRHKADEHVKRCLLLEWVTATDKAAEYNRLQMVARERDGQLGLAFHYQYQAKRWYDISVAIYAALYPSEVLKLLLSSGNESRTSYY